MMHGLPASGSSALYCPLAETLGLTLRDLFTVDDHSPADHDPSAGEDAERLIPILIDVAKTVAVDHLARALGWERDRLHVALDATPEALNGTGLRLHRSNGSVRVVPAAATDKRLKEEIGRVRNLGHGLNASEAAALSRVINGENVLDRQPSNSTRVAVGALKNMGCIALNDHAVFEPTRDLRLALPDI